MQWLYIIVCLVGLYGIVPQLGGFHRSFSVLHHIRPAYVVAIVLSCIVTYLAAAATYKLLAFGKLKYRRTLLVEVASMFMNHLLPGGIGGIGANYAYLRKAKLSSAEASAAVAINNSLGFLGHIAILLIIILIHPEFLDMIHGLSLSQASWLSIVCILMLVTSAALCVRRVRNRLLHILQGFLQQLRRYKDHPSHVLWALGSSVLLTLANVSGLWFGLLAIGVHLSFFIVLLVFTLGVGVGTVTPTPGGVGGVEAGLVAGLVAYHMTAAAALAAVLVYRLVSYWLALCIGAVVFVVVRKRQYI
jgi:uncharacterized protein (TIRG00374 family)